MDIKSAEKFMEKLVKAGMDYGFEECEASYATESSMIVLFHSEASRTARWDTALRIS